MNDEWNAAQYVQPYVLLRPGCILGVILVGRSDFVGFHCVTRMVTQGIGFCRSRYSLHQIWVGDRELTCYRNDLLISV